MPGANPATNIYEKGGEVQGDGWELTKAHRGKSANRFDLTFAFVSAEQPFLTSSTMGSRFVHISRLSR